MVGWCVVEVPAVERRVKRGQKLGGGGMAVDEACWELL